MKNISEYLQRFTLATLVGVSVTAIALTVSGMPHPQKDEDITRRELRNFDQYLDNHPEVAEQLRKNPSLINNEDFREKHPELREWLKNHPEAAEELKKNPRAFMKREHRFEKHERGERRQNHALREGHGKKH